MNNKIQQENTRFYFFIIFCSMYNTFSQKRINNEKIELPAPFDRVERGEERRSWTKPWSSTRRCSWTWFTSWSTWSWGGRSTRSRRGGALILKYLLDLTSHRFEVLWSCTFNTTQCIVCTVSLYGCPKILTLTVQIRV